MKKLLLKTTCDKDKIGIFDDQLIWKPSILQMFEKSLLTEMKTVNKFENDFSV